ncbi:hypothetical protein BSKO_12339 [Bryopsis sp. KO-2023]|nr:hypothetical protein BSKO_12339 [Bryopsis sp. KO-2023]
MFRSVKASRLTASLLEGAFPWLPWVAQPQFHLAVGEKSLCQQSDVAPDAPMRDYGMELLCRAKSLGWTAETMRKLRVHSMSTDKRILEVVEWLNSLGIADKDAGDVVRRFPRVVSHKTDTLQERVESLAWKLNLSKAQAFQIFISYPMVASKSDEKLAITFSYLSTLGIPPDRIAKMVFNYPPLLGLDIEAKVNSFRAVFKSCCDVPEHRFVKMMTSYPRALGISAETLTQKLKYLQSIGVEKSHFVRLVVSSVWGLSIENKMKPNVEWLKDKGCSEEEIAKVVGRDRLFLAYSIEKLDRNYDILKKLGLSDEDIVRVFKSNPKIFGLALDGVNMQSKFNFVSTKLREEVGQFIAKFPSFLNLSLKKRLAPRFAFCRKCGMEGPLPKLAFTAADKTFCESVVKRPLEEYGAFLTKWEADHRG